MQKHVKAVQPIAANADAMWTMDPQLMETVTRSYAEWFDRASRMRDESMRFAQEQFKNELDAVVQLSQCTNPIEAFAVQAEFANKLAADFFAEGQKFVEFMGEIATAISSTPKPGARH